MIAVKFSLITPNSKSYFDLSNTKEKVSKLCCDVYCIIKDNKIVREIVQLKKHPIYKHLTYRHTDKQMLVTTYYNKESVKKFREKFLDSRYIDPTTLDKNFKTNTACSLTEVQIQQINQFLISDDQIIKTTAKNILAFFQGSNPTGCKTKKLANRYILIDQENSNYNGMNILNAIREFRKKTKMTKQLDINLMNINDLEIISLDSFLEINYEFKKIFEKVNSHFFNIISDDKNDNFKTSMLKKDYDNINDYYDNVSDLCFSKNIDIDKFDREILSKNLRKYFTYACELAEKSILTNKDKFYYRIYQNKIYSIPEPFESDPERAHIIGVSTLVDWILNENDWIKKIEYFLFGIKHLNSLNLTPNLHSNYDKSQITIDPNTGYFVDTNFNKTKWKILHEELELKKDYIYTNYSYFCKYKRNL